VSVLQFKRALRAAVLAGVAVLAAAWDSRVAVVTTLLLANVAAFVFWSSSRTRKRTDRRYWLWCTPVYYFLALYLLWQIAPISNGGHGPGPGIYWGKPHLPTEYEFYQHHAQYLLKFSVPYAVAALVLTLLGCVLAPLIACRFKSFMQRPFATSAGTALLLMLLAAAVSDAGSKLSWWTTVIFLSAESFFPLAGLLLPLAAFTGIFMLARRSEFRPRVRDSSSRLAPRGVPDGANPCQPGELT